MNGSYVLHGLGMPLGNPTVSIETRASYGAHFLGNFRTQRNVRKVESQLTFGIRADNMKMSIDGKKDGRRVKNAL